MTLDYSTILSTTISTLVGLLSYSLKMADMLYHVRGPPWFWYVRPITTYAQPSACPSIYWQHTISFIGCKINKADPSLCNNTWKYKLITRVSWNYKIFMLCFAQVFCVGTSISTFFLHNINFLYGSWILIQNQTETRNEETIQNEWKIALKLRPKKID